MLIINVPIITGTFTPVVTLSGAGNVPQYSSVEGFFFKIGPMVYVEYDLSGDGGLEGSSANFLQLSLPSQFPAAANFTDLVRPIGHYVNGGTNTALYGQINPSGTVLFLFKDSNTIMTGADQNNTSRSLKCGVWYRAA